MIFYKEKQDCQILILIAAMRVYILMNTELYSDFLFLCIAILL
jgi:hypothetical protein